MKTRIAYAEDIDLYVIDNVAIDAAPGEVLARLILDLPTDGGWVQSMHANFNEIDGTFTYFVYFHKV